MAKSNINVAAVRKLKDLNEEFMGAFSEGARKLKPSYAELQEYSFYNHVVGNVLNGLEFFGTKKEEAVQALTSLKNVFDSKAANSGQREHAKMTINFGKYAAELTIKSKNNIPYQAYAKKLDEVLKSI